MPKVIVSKEQYDQVRAIEKAAGVKIAQLSEGQLRVPDCINGQCGIYRVKRCYRSGLKYIADMELVEATDTEEQAMFLLMARSQKAATEGKFKLIITE